MSQLFERWRIHRGLVRIILFRVLPGHEVEVGRRIEKECERFGLRKRSFRVFRLFGSYDLVFIQDDSKLTQSEFAQLGTIPGITGSTEYLCYNWVRSNRGTKPVFSISRLSGPLAAICFLKINPVLSERLGLQAELDLANYISKNDRGVQMLGTMGWYEIVLVISDSSLSRILQRIGNQFPSLAYLKSGGRREVFAEKTFTMLGHDLEVSGSQNRRRKIVSIEKELKNNRLEVHFSVSCTPGSMTKLERAALQHFDLEPAEKNNNARGRMTFRLGARDLDFSVKLDRVKTLNHLLDQLDEFRAKNASHLIRTHTELQYRVEPSQSWKPGKSSSAPSKTFLLGLTKTEAKGLVALGPEGASIATAIYQFNNLLQNRLLIDAFLDMVRAFTLLKGEARKRRNPLSAVERITCTARLQCCQQGVSQRYQGAYLGVEESPWVASLGMQPAGMGMQRILKALEFFSAQVLKLYGQRWGGFVLVGRPRGPTMEHYQDILIVPPNDALDLHRHWAMAHEIMHIMQFTMPHECSLNILDGRRTVANESDKLMLECITDIMEFMLSCTLTVQEYLKLVWHYLGDGISDLTEVDQTSSYLIRGFSVYCIAKCRSVSVVSESKLRALFNKQYIPLVESVRGELKKMKVPDRRQQNQLELTFLEFRGAILPYLDLIRSKVKEIVSKRDIPKRSIVRAGSRRIQNGQIVEPKALTHPDAIAWELAKTGYASNRDASVQTMAWLLSLWHSYQIVGDAPKISRLFGR